MEERNPVRNVLLELQYHGDGNDGDDSNDDGDDGNDGDNSNDDDDEGNDDGDGDDKERVIANTVRLQGSYNITVN